MGIKETARLPYRRLQNPSDQISVLRKSVIDNALRRQREMLLPKSTNIPQHQPLPVTQDKFEPKIENITRKEARALINGYCPEVLLQWQQSVVKQSSLKTVIDDGSILYQKLRGQFFRSNGRMPELKDLIEMSDQTLEEMMAGSKKKEEMTAIRQSMVRHNVLPLDSQIVFQIDMLGLPEWAREILVGHNIKTIESICQTMGKELESDEKTISISRFIKNQLLKFIQELAEWEKAGSSPTGLPTNRFQILEKKRRKTVKETKKSGGKKQAILEQYGLKDESGNITESWSALLSRLCENVPLKEVAPLLNISYNTLNYWRKEVGLPKRSMREVKRITFKKLSPEEKMEIKRQNIVNKLRVAYGIGDDPTVYINQKLKEGMRVEDLLNNLVEKGLLKISSVTFYQWLKDLGIPKLKTSPKKIAKKGAIYQKGADLYREAKQSGLLTRLVENQQVTLELVFGQGLTFPQAASRLSAKKNKNILPAAIRVYIVGALDRLKKLKSSPTDLAYLQAMFPNRFGTIIYDTLRKKNINTPEELKSFLAKDDDFTGIGIKGIQMCVEVLKHFFPDEELELIKLAYQRMLSMSFGKPAGHE